MEIRPILSALLRNKTAPLLIAAQIALTLAIACNALFIIVDRLEQVARPSGIDEANSFQLRLLPIREIDDKRAMQMQDLETLRALPGVKAAAWTNQYPLGLSAWQQGGLTTDRNNRNSTLNASYYFSGDSLIDAFDLELVEGRDFNADEIIENDPEVEEATISQVIVTQALAQQLYPNETSFVGRSFFLGSGPEADEVRILGVVRRLQTPAAQSGSEGECSMIGPVRSLRSDAQYQVRTEPGQRDRVMAAAEKALLALRSDRVLQGNRDFGQIRERRYAGEQLLAGLLAAVTLFLLLITASGIVGMASLWVNQRRKQIGVRRAMGARRIDIVRYFVVENLLIGTGGVLVGLVFALLLNDLLVRELSLQRLPASYLLGSMLMLWLLGLAAVLAPALRAAAVPPAVATRST